LDSEIKDGQEQFDPWDVLGLERGATDRQVSKAFLAAAKRVPPDRFPEEFAQVQRAHQVLRDPLCRAELALMAYEPRLSLDSFPIQLESVRKHVELDVWLNLLRRD